MIMRYKFALIAFWFVSQLHIEAQDTTVQKPHSSITDIDFAFDGGSILFEVTSSDGDTSFALAVNPRSPLTQQLDVGIPLLLCSNRSFDAKSTHQVSRDEFTKLLRSLIADQTKSKLTSHSTGVLLAIALGMKIVVWGNDAVDAIEKGEWRSVFQASVRVSPRRGEDPF